ncbi:hypothetical protein HanIR_Chr11g0558331 [Helianthus annuus]|nr:hypothetical protein HanIR_Chr11g0558331 [Helianthus annuus]
MMLQKKNPNVHLQQPTNIPHLPPILDQILRQPEPLSGDSTCRTFLFNNHTHAHPPPPSVTHTTLHLSTESSRKFRHPFLLSGNIPRSPFISNPPPLDILACSHALSL